MQTPSKPTGTRIGPIAFALALWLAGASPALWAAGPVLSYRLPSGAVAKVDYADLKLKTTIQALNALFVYAEEPLALASVRGVETARAAAETKAVGKAAEVLGLPKSEARERNAVVIKGGLCIFVDLQSGDKVGVVYACPAHEG